MKGVKSILLMAGRGHRFGDELPKQFHPLASMPVYLWTLEQLTKSNLFEEILLVAPPEMVDEVEKTAPPAARVIAGGETRQASAYAGLLACGPETEIVLIHDAVRPFVSQRILEENIEIARSFGACDTCIPSADTLVYSPTGETIASIPERSDYLRGQTPQTFSYPLILEAHEKTLHLNATDDCQLVLELGHPVHIAAGSPENLKITTKTDLLLAEEMVARNRRGRPRSGGYHFQPATKSF